MKLHHVLFVCGMCLVACSVGIGASQAVADDGPSYLFVSCTGGAACPDGDSSITPCEYTGRNCKTSEGCTCAGTGNTNAPLCGCKK